MFFRLLLLFTVVPFVELVILLKLSEMHGWMTTLGLIILTGIIGTILARQQGFEVWHRIQREMKAGTPPTNSLMDGLMILIASALLVTPGVLTDIVGFLLLCPPVRMLLRAHAKRYLSRNSSFMVFTSQQTRGAEPFVDEQVERPRFDENGREIIDVEYTNKSSE